MKAANVFAGIVGIIWLGLIWLGLRIIDSAYAQHLPGFPNPGQLTYYLRVPIAFVSGLALVAIISNRFFRSPVLLVLTSIGALLFLVPYMLAYTGGI